MGKAPPSLGRGLGVGSRALRGVWGVAGGALGDLKEPEQWPERKAVQDRKKDVQKEGDRGGKWGLGEGRGGKRGMRWREGKPPSG